MEPYAPSETSSCMQGFQHILQVLKRRRWVILTAAASGVMWGYLGAYLSHKAFGSFVWQIPPYCLLIGLSIYGLSYRFYQYSIQWLIPLSVCTIFISVLLFGFFVGLADLGRDIPGRSALGIIAQAILGCGFGFCMSIISVPSLWILFLLSFINHAIMRMLETKAEGNKHDIRSGQ